jgi:hypothetical protein
MHPRPLLRASGTARAGRRQPLREVSGKIFARRSAREPATGRPIFFANGGIYRGE